jgi:hypothetical protein
LYFLRVRATNLATKSKEENKGRKDEKRKAGAKSYAKPDIFVPTQFIKATQLVVAQAVWAWQFVADGKTPTWR